MYGECREFLPRSSSGQVKERKKKETEVNETSGITTLEISFTSTLVHTLSYWNVHQKRVSMLSEMLRCTRNCARFYLITSIIEKKIISVKKGEEWKINLLPYDSFFFFFLISKYFNEYS